MAPQDPCKGCKCAGNCQVAGLVARLSLEAWVKSESFNCPEYEPDYFHGVEGCYA
jgi:hypothetical protein